MDKSIHFKGTTVLTIEIWCVGGLKDKYWKEACAEYSKRLSAWVQIKIHELKERPLPARASETEIKASLEKEGICILDALPKNTYRTALCVEGRQISSEQLAKELRQHLNRGVSRFCYIIGGSHGLSEQVKTEMNDKLSFSKMVMPHMMARVFLLEQLYRAFSILHNGHYHK